MMSDQSIPPNEEALSDAGESMATVEAESVAATPPVQESTGDLGAIIGEATIGETAREGTANELDRPRAVGSGSGKPSGHGSPTALQDMFLNGLRRENIDAVVYFCDGSQERGAVRAFDTFTILLENRSSGKLQLIYKHSIARIFPTRCPQLSLPGRARGKS